MQAREREGSEVLLERVQGFLFDLDGCLVLSDVPGGEGGYALPGAADLLSFLRAHGRGVAVLTNASGRTPDEFAAILRGLGLDVRDGEVVTPAVVAALHVAASVAPGPVLAFGGPGVSEPLEQRGISTVPLGRAEEARFVLVGADPEFNAVKLDAACRAVCAGAELLVTSWAPWFAARSGRSPGVPSAIAAGIAHVTGVAPVVVGKPAWRALEASSAVLGVPPAAMAVVGDDAHLEVRMGREGGAYTVLVLTGLTRAEELAELEPGELADLVVSDLAELLARLEGRSRPGPGAPGVG